MIVMIGFPVVLRLLVATQDPELLQTLRDVPGVPLIRRGSGVMFACSARIPPPKKIKNIEWYYDDT